MLGRWIGSRRGPGSTPQPSPWRPLLAPLVAHARKLAALCLLPTLLTLGTVTPAHAISPGCSAVNAGGLDQIGAPLLQNKVVLGNFYTGDVLTMTFSSSVALPLSVVTLATQGPGGQTVNLQLPLVGTGPYTRTLTVNANTATGAESGILAVTSILGATINLTVRCSGVIGPTTTVLTSSPNPTVFGQSATFTATVATPAGAGQYPSGNVTFNIGGTAYGPVAVNASGVATYSTATLAPGTYAASATFAANANFATSTGSLATSQTVSRANTTTSVTASANPTFGSAVTFTATTSATSPGTGTPTGSVIFTVNGVDDSPVALSNGTATLTRSNLPVGATTASARYVASTNYNASSGTLTGGVTVAAAPTTTTITRSSPSTAFGDPVTFTAQVASSGGQPTGSVIFTVDGTARSPIALSSGAAALTLSDLTVGTHTISAAYQATTNFAASSGTLSGGHPVTTRPTTTTLSGPGSIEFGRTATITATVAGTGGPPTGTVVFTVDGTAQPAVALSGGTASTTLSGLSVGSHAVNAAYSGAATFAASSGTLTSGQPVTAATTTLALAASPATGTYGSASSFTASVTSAAGVPSGNVIFTVDGVDQAPIALSGGTAALTSSTLSVGTHTIGARYVATTNFLASTGALGSAYSVGKATPSLAVSSSASPSVLGQAVQLTANVTATSGTPSGTVTFTVDGTALPAVTISGGSASISLPSLTVGDHTVSIRYSGDTNFVERTGTLSGGQKVNPGNTSLAVSTSSASASYGTPITIRADIAATSPASGTPGGQVVFLVDGVSQSPVTLASGSAQLVLPNLAPGAHTISAAYQGSSDFNASTGVLSGGVTIAKATTSTTIALDNTTIAYGQSARVTATVSSATVQPAGDVIFTVNGTARPAVTLQSGAAQLDLSGLATGTYAISAAYGGSANHVASASATSQLTVTSASTQLQLGTSTQTARFGDPVTLSATLTSSGGVPDGTVEFLSNGTSIGTGTLSAGKASLTLSTLPVGNASITARYAGTSNFAAATAALATPITVSGRVPDMTVSISPTSAAYGQNLTATITVSSSAGTPQGNVTLSVGGVDYPAQLNNGTASIQISGLAPGSHAVTAAYAGQSPFLAASASTSAITVTRATSALALSATSATLVYGQSLALQAQVTSGFGTPTGGVISPSTARTTPPSSPAAPPASAFPASPPAAIP